MALALTPHLCGFGFGIRGALTVARHLSCFGISTASVSNYLNEMLDRVISGLSNHRFAKVQFPKEEKKADWAAMISAREPEVEGVIGFVDGVAFAVQCGESEEEQARDYNGYRHDTVCNNVFAFGPDGKIFFAAVNFPGSWHDSMVSTELGAWAINKMGDYKLCVDQGFPRSGPRMIRGFYWT